GQADDYRAYLDTFPNGLFSANARRSLTRLEKKPAEKKREIEVAKLSNASEPSVRIQPAEVVEIDTVENTEPLNLSATIAVARMPANAGIEAELEMDADKRAEIQKRLTVAGFKPGIADGIFGKGTRKALGNWQDKNELEVTGYLNAPQLQMLMQQTEEQLASYEPPLVNKPVIKRKRVEKPVVRSVKRKTRKKVVKKRVTPRKKSVVKRKRVKKKRVVKRKVRRNLSSAERRRRVRNEGYEGYQERRRRNRRNGGAIIGGAIIGGAIGIAIGRKRRN
ncbi:MAG: peptidoglycan-binding domain-containing protein, partial [Rhizobiaceae bacterium]